MLQENKNYTLTAVIKGDTFSDSFYSELSPLYNTINNIRNSEIGHQLDDIDDKNILLRLHDASVYADEIADKSHLNWTDSIPPYPVRQFVLEKTKYDLVVRVQQETMQFKSAQLADFSIKSPDSNQGMTMKDKLEKAMNKWKKKIIGPNTEIATLSKNDGFVNRPRLERTRRNTMFNNQRDNYRRKVIKSGYARDKGEGDGSMVPWDT